MPKTQHPEYRRGVADCVSLLVSTAEDFEEIAKRLTNVTLNGTPRTFNERKELTECEARAQVLRGSVARIKLEYLK